MHRLLDRCPVLGRDQDRGRLLSCDEHGLVGLRGLIDQATIDRAVLRVLASKFRLGLFDDRPAPPVTTIGNPLHRALSADAARAGLVLLKNDGALLPLRPGLRLAVIGPNADNIASQTGTYAPAPTDIPDAVSVLAGLRHRLGTTCDIRYARGCRIKDPDRSGFAEAIALARWADVVIAVFGGSSNQAEGVAINPAGQADPLSAEGDSDIDCGEGIDRASLDLSGVQGPLLAELQATGTPMALVLIQGRPHTLGAMWDKAQAALCAWYPGPYGGTAIAEVLAGDADPSGRLTVSFPHHVGQIPVHYNHKATAEKRYLGLGHQPRFRFGHGLSYTSFAYDNLMVDQSEIPCDGRVTVSVEVVNTGSRSGTEVVQVYLTDEHASVTRPVEMLCAFDRVALAPGERQRCSFTLGKAVLGLWDRNMRFRVEPGLFTLRIGIADHGPRVQFRVV